MFAHQNGLGDWVQMGRIKNRKAIPLSLFYLKYFACLFLAILAVIFGEIMVFNALVWNEMVYPADYAQEQAKAAADRIAGAEEAVEDLIPQLCEYAVFDEEGELRAGNIEKSGLPDAWRAVRENMSGSRGFYYRVIPREGEYCVLRYQIIPQYKSPVLRRYLPGPQNLILISSLFFVLLIVVTTAVCFGHSLKKKLAPLILAAEKIRKQELDFRIMSSDINEIAAVMRALEHMRAELKRSLESQWSMEQTKKEQILALAHDLKTPLTLVRGNAELLCETYLTEEQRECIGFIEKGSRQMQNYVGTFIEIAKDSYRPQFRQIRLDSFLEEMMEQAEGLCAAKNIRIRQSYQYEAQNILADHDLLMRGFLNVFANGAEYTPKGGIIYVEGWEEDGCIVFSVSDTGSGFSAEALRHGAEQFYRDDRSRNSTSHFGIGLFMTDLVMKQHNGRLILENSEKTGGAKVTLKIPR